MTLNQAAFKMKSVLSVGIETFPFQNGNKLHTCTNAIFTFPF
jgi:hypothetical protein